MRIRKQQHKWPNLGVIALVAEPDRPRGLSHIQIEDTSGNVLLDSFYSEIEICQAFEAYDHREALLDAQDAMPTPGIFVTGVIHG